ncbi:uncharacterized protein ACRADG_004522 [Cochliomyia hominivorax]
MKLIAKLIHIVVLLLLSFILKTTANKSKNGSECFDILDLYNTKQIEIIHKYTVEGVSYNSPANEIFECYLEKTRREGIISEAEKYFHVFRKCIEFQKLKLASLTSSHIDELELLGIPLYLENHVRERISNNQGNANDILQYIQDELGKKIALTEEYENYKNMIRAKLTAHLKSGQKSLYSWELIKVFMFLTIITIYSYY